MRLTAPALLLLLLAAPAHAEDDADAIWDWIWRERAELRAERAVRTEQTMRTERREPTPAERRAARERDASRFVAQRALDRQGCCAPRRRYVIVGSSERRSGCVVRDGARVFVDLDGDGKYDRGEPTLVVQGE